MAVRIQHDLSALNATRILKGVDRSTSKTQEQLASGYKINRAADDAANLAISEKMRSQIRGLNKANTNAQNGISMIQTAEGALAESHSILQRMRELAVKSANGTNTEQEREAMQAEIVQLRDELDKISETTEFNTMKVLNGSLDGKGFVSGESGPKFGKYDSEMQAFVTSGVKAVEVTVKVGATTGGEAAVWDKDGKRLTFTLEEGTTYTQKEIDNLIANARQEDSSAKRAPADLKIRLTHEAFTASKGKEYVTDMSLQKLGKVIVSSDVENPVIDIQLSGANCLNESASYDAATKTLTLNLYGREKYSESDIAELIAKETDAIKIKFDEGTATGIKAESKEITLFDASATDHIGANSIKFNAGKYGLDMSIGIKMNTFATDETEGVELTTPATYSATGEIDEPAIYTLSLKCGKEYSEADLEKLFEKAGVSMGVELNSPKPDEPDTFFCVDQRNFTTKYDRYFADNDSQVHDVTGWKRVFSHYETETQGTPPNQTTVRVGEHFDLVSYIYQESTKDLETDVFYLRDEKCENIKIGQEWKIVTYESYRDPKANKTTEKDERILIPGYALYEGVDGVGLSDESAYLGEKKKDFQEDGMQLQIGANSGQTMGLVIDDMSADGLGASATRVDVSTREKASESIDNIDKAIAKVSKQRSLLGAVQNRLEHSINSLSNTSENLQGAESQIRDADLAELMVEHNKNNILKQVGENMLAQQNQNRNNVLNLLS